MKGLASYKVGTVGRYLPTYLPTYLPLLVLEGISDLCITWLYLEVDALGIDGIGSPNVSGFLLLFVSAAETPLTPNASMAMDGGIYILMPRSARGTRLG